MNIESILRQGISHKASDIHIAEDSNIYFRINGKMERTNLLPTKQQVDEWFKYLIEGEGSFRHLFQTKGVVNKGYSLKVGENIQRFRLNLFSKRGKKGFAIRILHDRVPTYDELGLPKDIREISNKTEGIVLISGITGSGKTTTASSIVDNINSTQNKHIITIEDPIEYVYNSKKSLVSQRELGIDFYEFNFALENALREDPDVIVVGEMRSRETMDLAFKSAQTGHLVLSTIHSLGTVLTIQRIIDEFPIDFRHTMLTRVSGNLRTIVSQALVPTKDGKSRRLVYEVLHIDREVRELIGNGDFLKIEEKLRKGEIGIPFKEVVDKYRHEIVNVDYLMEL